MLVRATIIILQLAQLTTNLLRVSNSMVLTILLLLMKISHIYRPVYTYNFNLVRTSDSAILTVSSYCAG